MRIINIIGTKGGVGTSTAAATIAIALANAGERVALVERNASGDLRAIVGSDLDNLTFTDTIPDEDCDTFDFAVVDHATTTTQPESGTNVLVVSNCYMSILRATKLTWRPDALIAITEQPRALHHGDIVTVVGVPANRTIHIARDPDVARSIDAGLLAMKLPPGLRRAHFARFIYDVTADTTTATT